MKYLPPRLLVSLCGASFILLGAGCSSAPVTDEYSAANGTLGALANKKIHIKQSQLKDTKVKDALESYRRAANLFEDPAKRKRSIQMMAQLALKNAQSETPEAANPEPDAKNATATHKAINQHIDKQLYQTYMASAKLTDDKAQRLNMLGMASRIAPDLNGVSLKGDYDTAIRLYKLLLKDTTNADKRANIYYRLARAYAMKGDLNNQLKTLTKLTQEAPDSQYYVEAQFRRGEMLFANSEFDAAAKAYTAVINGGDSQFRTQSYYKRGWSRYKLAYYKKGLADFFTLLSVISPDGKLPTAKTMEAKMYQDTSRVIGLSFSSLNGPESARDWFASHSKDHQYEQAIYRALAGVYLHQQRFRDAADSYAMYVKVHPNNIAAPQFSTLRIQAYVKGHFPTLVLPAKQDFVEHYGIHSDYWATHKQQRQQYAVQLKQHLLDLATYYHAQAQKSDKVAAYEKPIRWYKEYLATPPVNDQQADINLRYAEVLYAAHHFADAIKQFSYTAYHYKAFKKANQAGYAALLSYQSLVEKKTSEKADQAVIDKLRQQKIAAGLKFAKHFNSDKHVPAVLKNVTDDQLANNNVKAAVETAGFLVNRKPTPKTSYLHYGWLTIANGEYDLKRYKVSEVAYQQLLALPDIKQKQRIDYKNRMAKAVYQQAANLKRDGKNLKAAAGFLRVAKVFPQATIRKQADFTAAALYLEEKHYKAAIPVLVAFKQRFSGDKLTKTIPAKLAVAYEKTHDYTNAASQLEIISSQYGVDKPEMARQALWKAANLQDKADRPTRSIQLYEKYARLYPTPYNFRAEAHYHLLKLYRGKNNRTQEHKQLKALVATWKDAGDKADQRVKWLAAYAAFHLAEPLYQRFKAIELTLPLKPSLAAKSKAMRAALKAYKKVGELKVAEFTPAANYRIASLYQILSHDILHSERPSGMGKLEAMQYEMLLENQALPYSDKAIDIYKGTANLAHQGIYNEWVEKSFARLAELVPGRYAKFEQLEPYVDIIY